MARKPTHGDCVKIIMHFHDLGDARGTYNAASIDEKSMWRIELRRCDE